MKQALLFVRLVLFAELAVLLSLQGYYTLDAEVSLEYSLGLFVFVMLIISSSIILYRRAIKRLPHQEAFLLLVILGVAMFAYPIKQLWIYADPSIMRVYYLVSLSTDLTPLAVGKYLFAEYLAYFFLMSGVWLCVLKRPLFSRKVIFNNINIYRSKHLSMMFAALSLLAISLQLFLMNKFGMYMGGGGVSLPFHLAGIILYSHLILMPILILLAIQLQPGVPSKKFVGMIALVILIYIIGDMLVRMSRGGLLVMAMLLLGFIAASQPNKLKKFIKYGLISIPLTVILIPVVTAARMAQVYDDWSLSHLAFQYQYYSETVLSLFVMRITGAEGLGMVMSSINFNTLDSFEVFSRGVISYYTNDVRNAGENSNTSFTPSALGEVFILFGEYMGFVVIAFLPLLLVIINRAMFRAFRFAYPISFAFLFTFSIASVTGGIFEKEIYTLLGSTLIVWVIDFSFSRVRSVNRSKSIVQYCEGV